jgi:hypothetical protein
MTIYAINEASRFKDGLVIVDQPHRGDRKVWAVLDEADFISRVNEWAEWSRGDPSDYDLDTFKGCLDYHSRDLSSCRVIRYDDYNLDDERALDGAVYLEWVFETEEAA